MYALNRRRSSAELCLRLRFACRKSPKQPIHVACHFAGYHINLFIRVEANVEAIGHVTATKILLSHLVTDGSTLGTALLCLLVEAKASRTCCMSFCRPSCQLVYSSWGCLGHWPLLLHSTIPWHIGPVGNDLRWPLCPDCIARSRENLCKVQQGGH